MAAIKGYSGAVNGVNQVFKWVIDQEAPDNPAANSATEGHAPTLESVTDWTGYYMAHGHTPGTNPNGALSFAGTIDQADATNNKVLGTAMVERWQVNWDWANNRPIWHQVWFGGNGALTSGSGAITDSSTPDYTMPCSIPIHIGTNIAVPVYTELGDAIAASLTCWSEVEPYVNSSTANVTYRAAGNLRWMVDVAVHVSDTVAMQALDGTKAVKLFVDAVPTTNWEVKYVVWKKVGPLEVDIQGRKLIAVQYRGMGAGYIDIAGTWTQGALTNPATTDIWPPA